MSDQPAMPADGTSDGEGVWQGGKWHPDPPKVCLVCERTDGTHEIHCVIGMDESIKRSRENPLWRAEERYSRTMRFDKYRAMQALLMHIADCTEDTPFQPQAKEILAGMVRPRGPAVRAADRATELEVLALAYRLSSGIFQVESPHLGEARALIVEALKAWERDHPPAAIDPLLGP